jgi:glycosyltransferase involved in cell wall biosynthesis
VNGPLVSVIVPVYNAEPFLRETLDSIFAMDYEPFEVIAVDDGSTDASAEIARSYPGVRFFQQENRGAGAARNAGGRHAQGEFLAYVDADDLVPANKLSLQVGYLLEHPDVVCVLGRQEWMNPPEGLARDKVFGDLDGIPLMSMVIRSNVLREVGDFAQQRGGDTSDMDMLIRLRERGYRHEVLPEIVLYRRYHGNNLVAGQGRFPVPPALLKDKLDRVRARSRERDG